MSEDTEVLRTKWEPLDLTRSLSLLPPSLVAQMVKHLPTT